MVKISTQVNEIFTSFLREHAEDAEHLLEIWNRKHGKSMPKKKATKPKKPQTRSSYIIFCHEYRQKTREEMEANDEFEEKPNKNSQVTKRLGALWNKLKESSSDEYKRFVDLAEKEKKDVTVKTEQEQHASPEPSPTPPDKEDSSDDEVQEQEPPKEPPKEPPMEPEKKQKRKQTKSAYMFFCDRFRADVKEILGNASQKEVMAELGNKWNLLKASDDSSDKELLESFHQMAADAKQ